MTRLMDRSAISAALADSQCHWRRNAEAERPEDANCGGTSCALCEMFAHAYCRDCPVRNFTGLIGCRDTPYEAAELALHKWVGTPTDPAARAAFRAAATREAEFLESLEVTP